MEALFDAPSSGHGCASVADMQQQLRQLLDSKVTPTKAEHVSVTFELRSNVTFAVPVTEAESASLEAGAGVDPRLFGGQRPGSTVTNNDGQLVRHINALDTVLNQSQDDPVVQRIVSKHIMACVGEADQSQWIMRSMTRGTQGWTFTYGCKDSAQSWARQNAKNPAKTVVAEWSNKDGQDPANLNRPAFDCRGTLTVAFSKSEKAISVKYEHTNMHKTVGELLDLLAPPPVRPQPIAIESRKSLSSKKTPRKTPKKRQAAEGTENGVETPGEEGVTPRPKKRKKSTQDGQDGEPSTQKKRSRKKKNDDGAHIDPALDMLPPEMPGARPLGDSNERPLYNTQAQQSGTASGSAYPDGLVGGERFNGSEAQASAMVAGGVHAHSILNLPAGEAERRRETAIRLLTEANVDPQTLTPEQFSIFANQSPALQTDSLSMLVKYGAERLRIVLPENAHNPSPSPASPNQDQVTEQTPPVDAQQSAEAAETPKRKRRASRKKAEADDTSVADGTVVVTQTEVASRQKKPRAPKLSRGACTPCRASKAKCGKEKPSCDQCLDSGTACSYPLQQSRKSKAFEEEAEDSVGAGETEQPADTTTPDAAVHEEDESDNLPSPGFSYEDPGAPPHQDSVNEDPRVEPDSASGPMQDNPQSTYGEPTNGIYHHASGLTFPDSISPEITQQIWTSGPDYSQTSVHGSTSNTLSVPQQMQESSNTLSFPEQSAAGASTSHTGTHHHQKSWGSYTSSQRSGVVDAPTTSSVRANNGHATTSWPAYSTSEATGTKQASASPRQSRRTAKPTSTPSYNSQNVPDQMHQASALAQAAMNSAAARTASPLQSTHYDAAAAISRVKSRQGMNSQTRTPVPSQPSKQPQRSTPTVATNTSYSTGSDKAAGQNYNNTYSQYSTNTDQSSNRVAYQPYSQQNTATATSSTYPNYDSYAARSRNTSNTLPLSNSATQQVASYSSSTPSTTSQWGDTSSQTRNPPSYTNSSTPSSSSVNMRSLNSQRSQIPPSFNVRPQAPTHTPTRGPSTATYDHPQHNVPQSSYNSYSSQPQQQTSSTQQQGWYTGPSGYGTSAARSSGTSSAGYSAAGSGGGSSAGGAHYGQQHQHQQPPAPAHSAMNLSGHTYSSMDGGEEAIYNMLPVGSGH
ncbi:hypothetical protein CONLIGDRAFT_678512 [Coniochaeta ligniaria NRRL 30616]|uniref:Zn(2)-C6 fungal-type domain-containing protein n=1 Tax=Coniochaeta ligniaria NRRL 30616 TaxID=1408157 RepID=A0A1J7IX60_9PEZI|nr:hypothetical protein CONLIGDRAFT_678512 [Coniochaeta ligniaria NRRL 30616]